jgi:hypothetical protein
MGYKKEALNSASFLLSILWNPAVAGSRRRRITHNTSLANYTRQNLCADAWSSSID